MKLTNKKTGEIVETDFGLSISVPDEEKLYDCDTYTQLKAYNSISELNEEWEDYEEPKEFWYVEPNGVIARIDEWDCCTQTDRENMKQIGNYFSSREEAEKAVEKLKAWKRLKDKGLAIKKWRHTPDMNLTTGSFLKIEGFIPAIIENMKDLDLLFGGENE